MASTATSVVASRPPPLVFQVTLPQATGGTVAWLGAPSLLPAHAGGLGVERPKRADSRTPTTPSAPLALPAPTIRFHIPSGDDPHGEVTPLERGLQTFFLEQSVTPSQQRAIRRATQAMEEEVREEQLKQAYFQLLLKETQRAPSSEVRTTRRSESDGIGHYGDDDVDVAATAITAAPPRPSALDAWKKLCSPASSAPSPAPAKVAPSLSSQLSSLLAISSRQASSNAAASSSSSPSYSSPALSSSPLAKLYSLACLYHQQHLGRLRERAKALSRLLEQQHRETTKILTLHANSMAADAPTKGEDETRCEQEEAERKEAEQTNASAETHDASDEPHAGDENGESTTLNGEGDSDSTTSIAATSSPIPPRPSVNDVIGPLFQGHLQQTSLLEHEWEAHLLRQLRNQRTKFPIFVSDTAGDYERVAESTREALSIHSGAVERREAREDARKRNKIIPTEAEEEEREKKEKEKKEAARPDMLALVRPFVDELEAERVTNEKVPRDVDTELLDLGNAASAVASNVTQASAHSRRTSTSLSASASSSSLALSSAPSSSAAASPAAESFASSPPSSTTPFPLQSLLSSTPVFLGSINTANLVQVVLTNDPLFVPATDPQVIGNMGPTETNAEGTAASPVASAAVPVCSSPLVSFPHFVSNLDALFGLYGPGGLSAMVLPHHLSPLIHAASSPISTETPGSDDGASIDGALDADVQVGLELAHLDGPEAARTLSSASFASSRAAHEQAQHNFHNSNLYVQNWLQYTRHHHDLVCEDFATQVDQAASLIKKRTTASDTSSSSQPQLAHGDIVVTKHSHVLNAQVCFHVNVSPRRGTGGASSSSTSATEQGDSPTSGGVVLNAEELEQQAHLLSVVLPSLISQCVRLGVRTLSLPLIWDNVLLSMWTVSGAYVGFGWKDVDAAVTGAGGTTTANKAQENRSEEMGVYTCMVQYLESHLRALKHCLAQMPQDSPLKQVVFYLPSASTQYTHDLDLDLAHSHNSSSVGSGSGGLHGGAAAHPFLAKCKLLFREIFQ